MGFAYRLDRSIAKAAIPLDVVRLRAIGDGIEVAAKHLNGYSFSNLGNLLSR
jgi:hypothetical protein